MKQPLNVQVIAQGSTVSQDVKSAIFFFTFIFVFVFKRWFRCGVGFYRHFQQFFSYVVTTH